METDKEVKENKEAKATKEIIIQKTQRSYSICYNLDDNSIYFNGEIYDNLRFDLQEAFTKLLSANPNNKNIKLYITSSGGYSHTTNSILELFDSLKRDKQVCITTIAIGKCSSNAIVLFVNGDKRYVYSDVIFIFHKCKSSILSCPENTYEFNSIFYEQYIVDISRHTGIQCDKIAEWCDTDETLIFSDQAIKDGLAHGYWINDNKIHPTIDNNLKESITEYRSKCNKARTAKISRIKLWSKVKSIATYVGYGLAIVGLGYMIRTGVNKTKSFINK